MDFMLPLGMEVMAVGNFEKTAYKIFEGKQSVKVKHEALAYGPTRTSESVRRLEDLPFYHSTTVSCSWCALHE